MMFPHAVIFDLGGTLVHSPSGDEDMNHYSYSDDYSARGTAMLAWSVGDQLNGE